MCSLPLAAILDGVDTSFEQGILDGKAIVKAYGVKKTQDLPKEVFNEAYAVFCHHWVQLNYSTLSPFKKLRLIVRYGVGLDNINLEDAANLGIAVCNVPFFGVEEVADSALCNILNLYRRTHWTSNRLAKRVFSEIPDVQSSAEGARRIRGQVLGLVGIGRIGIAIVERCKAFGFDICFYDPFTPDGMDKALGIRQCRSFDQLIKLTDCLVLMCPKTTENYHLINKDTIKLMKKGAFIVNTSRGGLIDEEALGEALHSGKLGGAGLDVHECEPFDWNKGPLKDAPNLLCTPHTAWYSAESVKELRECAAIEVLNSIQGTIPNSLRNCVNKRSLKL